MASQISSIYIIRFKRFQTANEIFPDALTGSLGELFVVDGKLDAGFETFIKGTNTVACEDEYTCFKIQLIVAMAVGPQTIIIFELTEKHYCGVRQVGQLDIEVVSPDTRAFLWTSCIALSCRNTSASSRRTTA